MNKKSLARGAKATVILFVMLCSIVFYSQIFSVYGENSPAIWTTDDSANIKIDFAPGEVVYIHGSDFTPDSQIDISITRPDMAVESCTDTSCYYRFINGLQTSDSYGSFIYEYDLNGILGEYLIDASDGSNDATFTFTDSSGAIWTTRNDCGDESQDVNHFAVGEHVYINGEGFDPGTYSWDITGQPGGASCDPGSAVVTGSFTVDATGDFCFDAYTVQLDDCGEYNTNFGKKGDNYRVPDYCVNHVCDSHEVLTLERTPDHANVDGGGDYPNKVEAIADGFYFSVDVSSTTRYLNMIWDLPEYVPDNSEVWDAILFFRYKEDSGQIETIEYWDGSIWQDTGCGSYSGDTVWANKTCVLSNLDMVDNTQIKLRMVLTRAGSCHVWLDYAKLNMTYTICPDDCNDDPYCGDGAVNLNETCELPSTWDNLFCSQTTTECLGPKLGTRNSYGDCDEYCGCTYDDFSYQCVPGQCGATCDSDDDCDDSNIHTLDTCNLDSCSCEYEYVPYCGDGTVGPGETCELPDTGDNTYCPQTTTECLGVKLGTRDGYGDCDSACGCVPDNFNYQCVEGQCGAECDDDLDCDDYDPYTVDTCNQNTCSCEYEQLPYCGDGIVNQPWEECDGGSQPCFDQYGYAGTQYCTVDCTWGECEAEEYCGDGIINDAEQCELPDTFDNLYCDQTTTGDCDGPKLGTRDGYGDCDSGCGCVDDPFEYYCVEGQCGAECDDDLDCDDKCVGDLWYYNGRCDTCSTCSCLYDVEDCGAGDGCYAYDNGCEDRTYFCATGGCDYTWSNRNTDYYDGFVPYCADDTIREHRLSHDFYCNGACSDHTSWVDDSLVEDCSLQNGWYDTGSTQWVSTDQCNEKEQKEQEYRSYTCYDVTGVYCDYIVTDHQWVDTGNTRYVDDGTPCDDGLYCTTPDTCYEGTCGGPARDCSHLGDDCNDGFCSEDNDRCEYIPYSTSTPCEYDGDLCTIDHCDASDAGPTNPAVCATYDSVDVPPAEECKSYYCEPSDGMIYEDYTNYPLSTSCEADGLYCTIDHCDGSGSCVWYYDYDCSDNNLPEIGSCDWIPDDFHYTWDSADGFTSICTEGTSSAVCTTGTYTYSHVCADNDIYDTVPYGSGCDAECDEHVDCQDYCVGDTYYYAGLCDLEDSCTCSYTPEDCDQYDYYDEWEYYCEADGVRRHRMFHDYSCGVDGCYEFDFYYTDDEFVEDCNLYDMDYCSGDYLMEEDWYCDMGSCTYDDNLIEDCYYYTQNCYGTESWYEQGYCDPAVPQCDFYEDLIEDCYSYNQYCYGTEVWYEEGYCDFGSCTTSDGYLEECWYDTYYCLDDDSWYEYGYCDIGSCWNDSYIDDSCDDDYSFCVGDEVWFHDEYCGTSFCDFDEYPTEDCDQYDYYDGWEYYCDGTTTRKHRIFHDFTCGVGSCYEFDSYYTDDSFVEECYYYEQYCYGTEVWYEEGYCSMGSCTYDEGFVQECWYEEYYCSNDDSWYEYGYCELGSCDYDNYMYEDCGEDYEFCSGDDRWMHDNYCESGSCDSSETPIEYCDSYDYWAGGGDFDAYGNDPACEYTDYYCVESGSITYCDYDLAYTEDFDYMDASPWCYDPRIGERDYWCDIGTCDWIDPQNGCDPGYTDHINGCSQYCNAECDEDADCQEFCVGDIYYYNGICDLEDSCTCSYTPEDCDQYDYYDGWEYYCDGTTTRKHRMFHDYSCGIGGCQEIDSYYTDDSFVEECYYYEQNCYGTESWYEEGYCSAGSCTYTEDFIEDCYSYEQYCDGTEVWYEEGYCSAGVCGTYDDYIEDCNLYDMDYCAGDQLREEDWYCDMGSCTYDDNLLEDCYYYTQNCYGTESWYEQGYCDPAVPQCDFYEDFIEDCWYDTYYCIGDDSWYEYGYCEFGDCDYDSYIDESCDDDYDFCMGDEIWHHDEYCGTSFCDFDEYPTEDCNQYSGWYDTGDTRWVVVNQCTEKEEKEQEYRSYTCYESGAVYCDYIVTDNQWVDTDEMYYYAYSTPCEADSDICTIDHCDGMGSCVFLNDYDDDLAPETIKTYGEPFFTDGFYDWATSETLITLTAEDRGLCSELNKTYYRVTLKENSYCELCDGTGGEGDFIEYTSPFSIGEDSCHLIEFYSVDTLWNYEEMHWQCVYIDNQPPETNKTVGEPKIVWDGLDANYYDLEEFCTEEGKCWKVTMGTPIDLNCDDPLPHPVENEYICFHVELDGDDATPYYCEYYDGTMEEGYCCSEEVIDDFYFLEESEHNLDYYCVDALDNVGDHDDEKFKVEGTAIQIEICEPWSLISVPFRLINSDPNVVFEKIIDEVESVWTYDDGNWYVWSPGSAPDSLDEIIPGLGYMVYVDEETTLVLGGSLFDTGPIAPPSNDLQKGWNMIGYYGTDWQEYIGFGDGVPGRRTYCSLYSLVDTTYGEPKWTSLTTFDSCNKCVSWKNINICEDGEWTLMYPGKGYWIYMTEEDNYGPASNCMATEWFTCDGQYT